MPIINNITNPDIYHGKNKSKGFFEGWYFKISDAEEGVSLALIPGIIKGRGGHSFIQYVNGNDKEFRYFSFKEDSFHSQDSVFNIKIHTGSFSLEGIRLKLDSPELTIEVSLDFTDIVKWPDSILNPGSMGFYNYLTFMECYSQVCALDGNASGTIKINDNVYTLKKGKIYIEKNWGKKFPYSWFWLQSNSFLNEDLALTCSIAHIPFPLKSFRGFLIGVKYKDEILTFTTINRSRLKIFKTDRDILISVMSKDYELILEPISSQDEFLLLHSPDGVTMQPSVRESITSKIKVTIKYKKTNKLLVEDIGYIAGIEYGGNYQELFNKLR